MNQDADNNGVKHSMQKGGEGPDLWDLSDICPISAGRPNGDMLTSANWPAALHATIITDPDFILDCDESEHPENMEGSSAHLMLRFACLGGVLGDHGA